MGKIELNDNSFFYIRKKILKGGDAVLSSAAERKIHEYLTFGNVPFEEEYIFEDLVAPNGKHLRFDFAIFDEDENLDCLIEYNGRQHYQAISKFGGKKGLYQQQFNDNLKRQYCLNHGYRLITIPFTEENKITYDYIINKIEGGY